ncbi:FkbM family methyltransferase [Thalassobaculum sp.]|uniref:FkbM family methyltransferase n=1 Tax=Thalassobaculum sp. TaxID=2022740 RepID=UPI0032EB7105
MTVPMNPFSQSALAARLREQPIGFVDIGARGGVHETVLPLAPYASVLCFEPDPNESAVLQAQVKREGTPFQSLRFESIGLAGFDGRATLHRFTAPTNDSLRPPNTQFVDRYRMEKWRKVGELAVPVRKLDSVIFDGSANTDGEILKIDTQGTELEILQGGERTLRERTVAVICEVSFAELYAGQGLFSEVERWLRALGFSFYGFDTMRLRSHNRLDRRNHWSRERVIQADAVFFKDPLMTAAETLLSARQHDVLIASSVLFEFFEFARELVDALESDPTEADLLRRWIDTASRLDLASEVRDVEAVLSQAKAAPETAAIGIGTFVDSRRKRGDVSWAVTTSPET